MVELAGLSPRTRELMDIRIEQLARSIEVFRPQGKGPFPTVIQLHGCGGRKPAQADWARAAVNAGWAAITVDSYAHRGVSRMEAYATICTGVRFWGRERAGDLYAAMEWVRRQSWANGGRMVVAGWSHGGWTVLDALSLAAGEEARSATGVAGLPDEPLAGLVGAFVVYPYVGPGCLAARRGLRAAVNVAAIVGGRDHVVGGGYSRGALERMATAGPPVEVMWLAEATHAFDEPDARDLRVTYDPALTARAMEQYATWLSGVAAPQPARH
ncbi:prolyl oligopeptidase family serine peptidase [bacterium]|nr:prolyl oligopeptidase family serine peptidase [bacterium]